MHLDHHQLIGARFFHDIEAARFDPAAGVSTDTPIHSANLAMGISGGMSAEITRLIALTAGAWVGLAAVLGHLYPLYFNFRGGKGVATAAGMLLGLYPPAALLALAAWALVFLLTRTSSLASLIATPLTLPLLAWQQPAALLPACVLTGLIVWRHRHNLRDLFAGRERRF